MRIPIHIVFALMLLLGFSGCMSYYARECKFNEAFQQGQLESADAVLAGVKKPDKRKTRLLYYLNRGTVASLTGKYEESNALFEQALTTAEGISKNYLLEGASLLTNPYLLPYKGEDFELLMVHYYKAMNYLGLRQYDAALVECRRMQVKLDALAEKYKSNNRYRRDAFIHLLMGLIYDADRDWNNAFVAYRNAFDIYEDDYSKLYGMATPEQLKADLLRTAYLTGLPQEVKYYEKKFGVTYKPEKADSTGSLVFFWLNGMGPVKDQESINLTVVQGQGNMVYFTNDEYGLNFPFYYEPSNNNNRSALADLHLIRLALPKYIERPPVYTQATLVSSLGSKKLEPAENINKIAMQSLQDRMLREMGTGLLRLAIKKSEEMALRKQNQELGAALGVVNFLTEQADTRNWQTLPYSLSYSRLALPSGNQQLTLDQSGPNGARASQTFNYQVRPGQTIFQSYHTLAAYPPDYSGRSVQP